MNIELAEGNSRVTPHPGDGYVRVKAIFNHSAVPNDFQIVVDDPQHSLSPSDQVRDAEDAVWIRNITSPITVLCRPRSETGFPSNCQLTPEVQVMTSEMGDTVTFDLPTVIVGGDESAVLCELSLNEEGLIVVKAAAGSAQTALTGIARVVSSTTNKIESTDGGVDLVGVVVDATSSMRNYSTPEERALLYEFAVGLASRLLSPKGEVVGISTSGAHLCRGGKDRLRELQFEVPSPQNNDVGTPELSTLLDTTFHGAPLIVISDDVPAALEHYSGTCHVLSVRRPVGKPAVSFTDFSSQDGALKQALQRGERSSLVSAAGQEAYLALLADSAPAASDNPADEDDPWQHAGGLGDTQSTARGDLSW